MTLLAQCPDCLCLAVGAVPLPLVFLRERRPRLEEGDLFPFVAARRGIRAREVLVCLS